METGSIAKWLVTEGARFEPGVAICEVETDKVLFFIVAPTICDAHLVLAGYCYL